VSPAVLWVVNHTGTAHRPNPHERHRGTTAACGQPLTNPRNVTTADPIEALPLRSTVCASCGSWPGPLRDRAL
jgi:hypothetical protein